MVGQAHPVSIIILTPSFFLHSLVPSMYPSFSRSLDVPFPFSPSLLAGRAEERIRFARSIISKRAQHVRPRRTGTSKNRRCTALPARALAARRGPPAAGPGALRPHRCPHLLRRQHRQLPRLSLVAEAAGREPPSPGTAPGGRRDSAAGGADGAVARQRAAAGRDGPEPGLAMP